MVSTKHYTDQSVRVSRHTVLAYIFSIYIQKVLVSVSRMTVCDLIGLLKDKEFMMYYIYYTGIKKL